MVSNGVARLSASLMIPTWAMSAPLCDGVMPVAGVVETKANSKGLAKATMSFTAGLTSNVGGLVNDKAAPVLNPVPVNVTLAG